jgi:hypothetical protein
VTTSVSGPGQKTCTSFCANSGSGWAKRESASVPLMPAATWTISGWSEGRPLALKMPATAMSLVASAPRP